MYKNVKPIKIKVFVANLRKGVLEHIVSREIKKLASSGLEEAYLYTVTHGKLYTISSEVIDKLSGFIDEKTKQVITIPNNNEEHSNEESLKVIGRLTYQSLDLFLHKNGFKTIPSKLERGKRVYYKEAEPFFVYEPKNDLAVFKAIRGLMPKVYVDIPISIYLFFVPDGSYIVEVKDWKKLVGEQVKIRRRYLEEQNMTNINYSKVFMLKDVKDNNAIIIDETFKTELKVPLSEIYVPANTTVLSKFGVFKQLLAFTSFRDYENKAEYKFLEKALEIILPNKEEFTLRIGLTDVVFRRIEFEL